MKLREQFEKETGYKALYQMGSSDYHTLKYVKWLENKLRAMESTDTPPKLIEVCRDLEDYLVNTPIAEFDIPDEIWKPFESELKKAVESVDKGRAAKIEKKIEEIENICINNMLVTELCGDIKILLNPPGEATAPKGECKHEPMIDMNNDQPLVFRMCVCKNCGEFVRI